MTMEDVAGNIVRRQLNREGLPDLERLQRMVFGFWRTTGSSGRADRLPVRRFDPDPVAPMTQFE